MLPPLLSQIKWPFHPPEISNDKNELYIDLSSQSYNAKHLSSEFCIFFGFGWVVREKLNAADDSRRMLWRTPIRFYHRGGDPVQNIFTLLVRFYALSMVDQWCRSAYWTCWWLRYPRGGDQNCLWMGAAFLTEYSRDACFDLSMHFCSISSILIWSTNIPRLPFLKLANMRWAPRVSPNWQDTSDGSIHTVSSMGRHRSS